MASEPTGRALAEAAARAMGWTKPSERGRCDDCGWPLRKDEDAVGCERDRCSMVYNTELRADTPPEPTDREMLAWLHERGFVHMFSGSGKCHATIVGTYGSRDDAGGPTLRDALMRLVVAVAEREARA